MLKESKKKCDIVISEDLSLITKTKKISKDKNILEKNPNYLGRNFNKMITIM